MSRAASALLEHDLLTRLGLSDGASEADVDGAHDDIVAFLEAAPADLRLWARGRAAEADEAYALLSDRTALEAAAAASASPISEAQPAARTRRARARQAAVEEKPQVRLGRVGPLGRALMAVAAVLAIVVAGYVVYTSDLPSVPGLSGTPAPEGDAQLDTARVAGLMQIIQANPNDIASLQELADLYFDAADYAVAASWENKILAIEPDNLTAHLAVGAAQYNLGNDADAETHWRRVLELDPQNVEAHYDLGFMYFSSDPPDVEKTIVEWRLVVEIAPDSDIAQTVATHLQTLEGWQASASPGASGSPAITPTPAASPSPRPSPLPSASGQ